jgi:hypothetical protein
MSNTDRAEFEIQMIIHIHHGKQKRFMVFMTYNRIEYCFGVESPSCVMAPPPLERDILYLGYSRCKARARLSTNNNDLN